VTSPFVSWVVATFGLDWARLANVGDSYGPVSTILSGAALIGVVVALNLQRQQTGMLAEHAGRQMQMELMREAWSDPELLQAVEIVEPGQEKLARQSVYVNMLIMYLRMQFKSRQITQEELEDLCARHFSTEAGAYYWRQSRNLVEKYQDPKFFSALKRGYERSRRTPEGSFVVQKTASVGTAVSESADRGAVSSESEGDGATLG
jgi:hypothetical protein